jgi:hypothetical protein
MGVATGTAAANGIAPDLAIAGNRSVSPITGDATAAGIASVLNLGAIVDTANPVTATASGVAPSWAQNTTVLPGVGAAVANGVAPAIFGAQHVAVAPLAGAATAGGLAPSFANIVSIATSTGEAAAAGLALNVRGSALCLPHVGTAAAVGIAPHFSTGIEQALTPATGTAIADGPAPIWRVAGFSATIVDRGARSRFTDRSAFAPKDKAA